MANVPGTEIEKPSVALGEDRPPAVKVAKCARALRRAGVPVNVVVCFVEAARGPGRYENIDDVVADYVETGS